MTMVWPSSSTARRMKARISPPLRESRLPVGSSAKITDGRVARARATATRCCWPPDSSAGRCFSRSPRPTVSTTPWIQRLSGFRPDRSSGRVMFSPALNIGSRLNAWNTKPTWSRRSRVNCFSDSRPSSTSPMNTRPGGPGSRRRGRAPRCRPSRTPSPPVRLGPRWERGTRPTRPSFWSSRRSQSLLSALAAPQRAARASLALSPLRGRSLRSPTVRMGARSVNGAPRRLPGGASPTLRVAPTGRSIAAALALAGLGSMLGPTPAAAAPPEPDPAAPAELATVPPTNAFPVPAPYKASFSDDWHACRDGCRRQHKGNDVFADEATPIVAVEPGVIAKVDGTDDSNGGLSIWLLGDSGVAYWYAHNSANYVTVGQRVGRGQLIGRVGHTGNARTTPSHIHFQVNRCGELNSAEPCTANPFEFLSRWTPGQIGGGADALGLYRRSASSTELRIEGGSALPAFRYRGTAQAADATTLAVAGDWNGDGRDTVGLYQRDDATFVLRDDRGQALRPVAFGWPGASDVLPAVGDWNGDGRDSLGLYRSRDGVFRTRDEANRHHRRPQGGLPGHDPQREQLPRRRRRALQPLHLPGAWLHPAHR